MPIHKVGYRPWEGERLPAHQRWWIITSTGFRLALKSRWVRRLLFVCWLPVFYWGLGVFFLEQYLARPELNQAIEATVAVQESQRELLTHLEELESQLEGFKAVVDPRDRRERDLLEQLSAEIKSLRDNPDMGTAQAVIRFVRIRRLIMRYREMKTRKVLEEQAAAGMDWTQEPIALEIENALPPAMRSGELIELLQKHARQPELVETIQDDFDMLPQLDVLADALRQPDQNTRHAVWSWLLMTMFRYPQASMILFLLGFVAPGLIARDVRSRAFLLYFSRPIGQREYILGKLMIPGIFVAMVTLLPAMALYLFGIMLSPDMSVVLETWDIAVRLALASITLILPTASLALMLSSVTQETRFATFAWFAVWALGHGAWLAIVITQAVSMQTAPFDPEVLNSAIVQNWSLLSLYNNLGHVQNWIFGFDTFENVAASLAILVGVTVVSIFILYRRVSAPIRV